MKYLLLSPLIFAALGCGHNEFDVDADQVKQHKAASKSGVLPPTEVKTGNFKKGDRLPDGAIADGPMKISSDGK
jgi:hypothetical protein